MGWSRGAVTAAVIVGLIVVAAPPGGHAAAAAQSAPASTRPAAPADPVLDRAEALLAARRTKDAKKILIRWLNRYRKAPDRDRALSLMAQVYFDEGDRLRSFYQLDELLDRYPESRLFFPSLEKQYRIADGFLSGYKLKFLGMRILGAEDEAIEMLYRIQERAPGSAIAERSLLRTADYYYQTSQFDFAADAYAAYVRLYPRSPSIGRVKLRQAFSSLAQFRGIRFDATPLIDARSQFQELIAQYPAVAAEANVRDIIDRINDTLAAKVSWTADFYRRTGKPGAAVYNWRYLTEAYPNSRDARAARRQLARMPASALKAPPPPAATQPAELQQAPARAPVPPPPPPPLPSPARPSPASPPVGP